MGICRKILKINLTTGEVAVEEKEEEFMRMYPGGGAIGAYYLLREMAPGTDPLGPDNVLVFAGSVVAGAPVSGLSRYTVTARSPLTSFIGDSQAGGNFAVELLSAGYVAVVISGRSSKPVYLLISGGMVEIRDASGLWGMEPAVCEAAIKKELGDDSVIVAQIGPGGERMVRFASIVSGLTHFNGRTGMGAVMGSKNLKAVVVRGGSRPSFRNPEALKELARRGANRAKTSGIAKFLRELGTAGAVSLQNGVGGLPTRNFTAGHLEGAEAFSGEELYKLIPVKSESCYRCVVGCKKKWKAGNGHGIDPAYGVPEYESLAALGSYTGVTDPAAILKANELCSRYTIDTISTGAAVALAMECFKKGILSPGDTGGLHLRFGDGEALVRLVDMIGRREGIGDQLAEGSERVAELWGRGAGECVVAVKGLDLPAHMPQLKKALALTYAVNPFGADHMSSEHDGIYTSGTGENWDLLACIGLYGSCPAQNLNADKVRFVLATQKFYSLLDTFNLCMFCFALGWLYTPTEVVEVVRASTGWNVSLYELMMAGERRVNMQRVFNLMHGASPADDRLPARLFSPLKSGPSEGLKVDENSFDKALALYYQMAGWDPSSGWPSPAKLHELSLGWLVS